MYCDEQQKGVFSMGDTSENKPVKHKKQICVGILAHVDAGKTTLAEGLLYTCGRIRKLGRVDHKDAFLDHFSLERERGITIFSKQAQIAWEGLEITLLDTPGHVDFSAEMERTLQVLDYALLIVSGADGVQGHTQTLWRLLKQYGIPVFLFVNKMDQPGTDKGKLLRELQERLDSGCQEFGPEAEKKGEAYLEELAMCDEQLMDEYLDTGTLAPASVACAIAGRHVFPCYFGSALRLEGVEDLLKGIRRYCVCPAYPEEFGARVYKISRDDAGNRLTHLKVTGGVLRVKMLVSNAGSVASGEEIWEEKADQIRIYGGNQYSTADQVEAGGICAVAGFGRTFAGQGLGIEHENEQPVLTPVLSYGLQLPEGTDAVKVLGQMRRLEEEDPQLHIVWQEAAGQGNTAGSASAQIQVQVMGEVQIEVLKKLVAERFGLEVEFVDGHIVYKETIVEAVEGIGHFEPLRHYAEVHLLLEPGEPGSGLQFASACSEDVLDRNWQRLILTHLEEKSHVGVLTGSPLTDMKITLLTGRAHKKHTEGGDFRQATYRAVRQGLMQCKSVLLEPVYAFNLEVPAGQIGRAMSDIRKMCGSFEPPASRGEYALLTGSVPAAELRDYQKEVNAYTRGLGRLSCTLKGYEPCHNTEEVMARSGYQPDADQENPSSSVFCAHGAGFVVSWDRVAEYAHVESGWHPSSTEGEAEENVGRAPHTGTGSDPAKSRTAYITLEEIEEIFKRTYGKSAEDYAPYRYHQRNTGGRVGTEAGEDKTGGDKVGVDKAGGDKVGVDKAGIDKTGTGENPASAYGRTKKEEYLLVDGYNIIFAWEDLRSLAESNIDSARDRLMDICCNYQGYMGCTLILVYDAYKVKGNPGSVQKYYNIYVVYTREAETADQYIEKTVHKIGRKYQVTVATSDALEQMIIWGEGAVRLSARGFREAVDAAARQMRERKPEQSQPFNPLRLPVQEENGE